MLKQATSVLVCGSFEACELGAYTPQSVCTDDAARGAMPLAAAAAVISEVSLSPHQEEKRSRSSRVT